MKFFGKIAMFELLVSNTCEQGVKEELTACAAIARMIFWLLLADTITARR
jgi:hypothetical protein